MSNCKIQKNQQGKIIKVLDQVGNPSTLFQQIFNVPTLTLKDSIEIYSNVYSKQIQDKYGIKRLSQTEERGIESLGEIATGANNILRGSRATGNKNQRREKQIDDLRVWSYDNGFYIEDYQTLGKFQEKGMESEVFYSNDNKSFIKVNDLEFYDTPSDFLNALALHNQIFPDTPITLKGFTTRQDNFNFAFITEQPLVVAERGATQEEVKAEMEKLGFQYVEDNTYKNDRYTIEDLHEGNVLVDESGKLRFIDTVIRLNETEGILEEPQPNFNGYSTYKQAVENTPLNENIEIKIDDIVIGEVNSNNKINNLIRQEILEDKRELQPNGDVVYITNGNNLISKIISGNLATEVLGGVVDKAGNVRVKQKVKTVEVFDSFEKNKKQYGVNTALSILATDELEKNIPAFGRARVIKDEIEIPSETVLMSKLKNLLNQLGVKSMNLDTWEKRMGTKTNSNALADITNRIVAFAEGKANQDTLSEEASHFIIEALDQEKIKPILDLVNKTDEWKEYYPTYMQVYNGDENLVRKEILGKVLKNALQARQQQTLQGQSVTNRILQYFQEFIEYFRNLFTDNHKKQLNQFTEEIYEKLIAEDLFSELRPEQFEGNKIVMYQTQMNDTLLQSIAKLKEKTSLIDKKSGGVHQVAINEIDVENINELQELEAIANLASIIKKHTTYLNNKGKKQGFLSREEGLVYNATLELALILKNITPKLTGRLYAREKEKALKSANEALTELTALEANLNSEKEVRFNEIVDRLTIDNNLTQSQKDILLRELRTQERDTNNIYSWFGGAIHAQNPIINMLGKIISKMTKEGNVEFSELSNNFMQKMNDLGYEDEKVAGLLKSWARGNYLFSPYNHKEAEDEKTKIQLETYKKVAPKTFQELSKGVKDKADDFKNNYEKYKNKLTSDEHNEYRLLVKEAIDESKMFIDALNPKAREAYKKMMEDLNLNVSTRRVIQSFKDKRSKVLQEVKKNNGHSDENSQQLIEIKGDYDIISSPFDSDGEVRKGLQIIDDNVILADGYTKDKLDKDSLIALELNQYREALTDLYKKDNKSVFQGFYNEMENISKKYKGAELQRELVKFIDLNSRVFYTEDFWKSSTIGDSITDRLREENTEKSLELARKIEKFNKKLKNILKRNKFYNKPSEINFDNMSEVEKAEVKSIAETLDSYYRETREILGKRQTEDIEKIFESVANEAFTKELENRDLLKEIDNVSDFNRLFSFMSEHMTTSNADAVRRMRDKVVNYEGYGTIKGLEATEEELQEDIYGVLVKYSQNKLLPYFKKIVNKENPNLEYELKSEYLQAVLDNKGFEYIENLYKEYKDKYFIDISPSFIFEDSENSDRLNPEFEDRIKNNEPILSDKFRNTEFFEYFGLKNGTATKNEKEYEAWKTLVELQEKSLEKTNMLGKHNKYLLPQFRRQKIARLDKFRKELSAEQLKQGFRDAFTYRETDYEMGQLSDGRIAQSFQKTNLTIPKIGFNRIEEKEVTDELLYSYMMMLDEAVKYEKRTEAWADVESLEHYLKGKSYGDKKGEKTETYKMFSSLVKSSIYGQKETFTAETDLLGLLSKKQAVAPAIRQAQSFVRNNNLAYSILTPMTSFFQGVVNLNIEKVIGDRIDKDAVRLSRKEIIKMMPDALSEFTNVRKKSKLNYLLQFVGQETPSNEFQGSNYGRFIRNTPFEKSGYWTHYIADVPIKANVVLSVLNDYRIVDDQILNYREWRRKNRSLTEKQARAEWKNFEDKTIFKLIEQDKSGNYKPTKELSEIKNYKERIQSIRDVITSAKQDVDYQIPAEDKSQIQRHALLSIISLMKGWLFTSIMKRTKDTHRNLHTNLMEEGTYFGTGRFVVSMMKGLLQKDENGQRKGFKELIREYYKEYDGGFKLKDNIIYDEKGDILREFDTQKEAKEYYEELVFDYTQMRQTSLKRAGMDLIVTSALTALGIIFANMADDDDDKPFIKEMLAYSTYRLASEVSSQSFAIPAQAYQFLESPTVGMSQLQNTLDVLDVFNGEEVSRGTYKGLSKREAWVVKMIPIFKEYNKLSNMERTRNSFEFFNKKNLKFTPTYWMLNEEK